jgi:hypothetical protein
VSGKVSSGLGRGSDESPRGLRPSLFICLAAAAVFALLFGATSASAQQLVEQEHTPGNASGAVGFGYKFENPRFYIPLIEVSLNLDGSGEVRFRRGESDEILDLKLKLLPATIARIRQLVSDLRFLTSNEDYQADKDFSHLGWVTISVRDGERERKARFNYTTNVEMKEMMDIFRGLATQAIHLFDLDLAARYQPLDLPRQVETVENDLRLGYIAEPEQMLGPLGDISSNDSLPLIARNKAKRIVTDITKGKYRSPVKAGK